MKKFLILIISILTAWTLPAQELTVEAPNLVEVGESFNLSFVYDGSENVSDFTWAEGSDFMVVWGPQQGSSTSISIVNGKTTKSVKRSYTYVLQAVKPGVFQIPSASLKVKGKTLTSESRRIEVVASSAPAASSQQAPSPSSDAVVEKSDDIILKMELSKRNVVKGEPIQATLKLYQRVNITGFDDVKLPSFHGFWSQDITPQRDIQFVRENYNGMIYNAAVIKDYVIIPQKSGTLTIDPAELVCLVYQRISHSTGSIFDGFFDDYKTLRVRVATKAVNVSVHDLPAGAPKSFCEGVGKFEIQTKISRDSLKAHEAASLFVTIKGRGNLSLLEAPKPQFPPDFELYDTKITDNLDKESGNIVGSRTYEFPFIPRSHGDFVIPAVEYSYYDVSAKKYVSKQGSAHPIVVERGHEVESAGGPTQIILQGANKKGVKNLASDIRFIHTQKGELDSQEYFLMGSTTFVCLLILMLILFLTMLYLTLRRRLKNADAVAVRTRKATKMARRRLKDAGDYLSKQLNVAFYEALHKALLGYACDKLNIPLASLTKESIESAFAQRSVAAEDIQTFVEILDACEMARYSPQEGQSAMQLQYEKAVQIISSIDGQITHTKKARTNLPMLLLLISLGLSTPSWATEYVDSLWSQATQEYTAGNFEAALQAYTSIADLGLSSADLHYNLGNAYFKNQQYGRAILHYEKALKIDPSQKDARYNLEIANDFIVDEIEQVPEFILTGVFRKMAYWCDSDTWTVIFLVLFALLLGSLLFFFLSRSLALRKTGFGLAIAAFLLAGVALGFALSQKRNFTDKNSAVIVRSVVEVKSSPTDEGNAALFILHEGTKVKLLDAVGNWKNIELSDGRQGWMKASDLEII